MDCIVHGFAESDMAERLSLVLSLVVASGLVSPWNAFGSVPSSLVFWKSLEGSMLFFVCLVEFAWENIWPWSVVCKFYLNYRFGSTSSDWSVQVIYFFLLQFWYTVFLKTCPFFVLCWICWQNNSTQFSFFISVVSVINSPLPFLIYFRCIFFYNFKISNLFPIWSYLLVSADFRFCFFLS